MIVHLITLYNNHNHNYSKVDPQYYRKEPFVFMQLIPKGMLPVSLNYINHLWEPCFQGNEHKLKFLCLAYRKHLTRLTCE